MYFVNSHGFVIETIDLTKKDVDSTEVKAFQTSNELQKAFPSISDEMIDDIPFLSINEDSDSIGYFLTCKYNGKEELLIEFGKDIHFWIETQTESFCVTNGVMF